MDILAHTLWANAGARGANILTEKKGKKFKISPAWTGFFGVAPDFFAFTAPFLIWFWRIIFGPASWSDFGRHHLENSSGFDLASYLYQWSHSLVIFAIVFVLVWVIYKRPRYELLGWLLHILIDIPSHSIDFYPTPFLFPISEYRFPYGVSWGNSVFMIVNYSLLALVWGYFLLKKWQIKKPDLSL